MRSLVSVFGHLFRTLQRVIFTPFLLGWLIVWMAIGCAVGMVIATPLIFGIFRENPGESAWHWLVFAPLMFVGVVFAFRDWLYRSGAESFFGLSGDSHGSARFANRKDLKKLEGPNKLGSNAGLLIGRDPHTGRLLRYDGPAHVLDPFEVTGIPSAAYNPLDRLSPDSLDLGEDAASLTEALVMDAPRPGLGGALERGGQGHPRRADHVLRLPRGEEPARAGNGTGVPHPAPGTAPGAAGVDAGQRCGKRAGGPAPPTGFSARRTGKRHRSCRTRSATPTFWTARALPEFCRARISTSRSCACWSSQALNDIARDAETAAVASSALSGPTERLKGFEPRVGGPALFLLDEFRRSGPS